MKTNLEKREQEVLNKINKSNFRNAFPNWRNHVPIYGWKKMNYPSTIEKSLKDKIILRNKEKDVLHGLQEEEDNLIRKNLQISLVAAKNNNTLLFSNHEEPSYQRSLNISRLPSRRDGEVHENKNYR